MQMTNNFKYNTPKFHPVYTLQQESLIKSEFPRLKGECYLEHAGTTLYSSKQISKAFGELSDNIYGNPHARSTSSKLTDDAIDQIRYQILQHFNTSPEEYSVIFTSGATAALKLIAENFVYNDGTFAYLEDNHTSVLGMRECATNVTTIPHRNAFEIFSSPKNCTLDLQGTNSLFVYPAQCNFSGTKYPLSWISKVQRGALNGYNKLSSKHWFCMVDAAAFMATNFLDLSVYKPDFLCVSFYKIFGYPTGLGALIVKNTSAHVLRKRYFGGGTVLMAMSVEQTHVPHKIIHKQFEDGTLPFLSILALRHGFETFHRLSLDMKHISLHTFNLARYAYQSLLTLHHSNGNPVAILYHDTNYEDVNQQGGIVNFNIIRPSGEFIGYSEVLHLANLYNIHLRTGCFCNPGACQRHLKLTPEDVKHHFESGHVCGDQHDLVDGYPTGSVRISFGYMSTEADVDTFLQMIVDCFVTKPLIKKWRAVEKKVNFEENQDTISNVDNINLTGGSNLIANINYETNTKVKHEGSLMQAFIYPIKSCGAFQIQKEWKITTTGFMYDRQWMIINSAGVCVTQKHNTNLCLIRPIIDIGKQLLNLHYKDLNPISIPLIASRNEWPVKCQSKVCGDRIQGWDCGNEVAHWLSKALGSSGLRLLRQCNNLNENSRSSKNDSQLSLANQAQFLLINTASVEWLLQCLPQNEAKIDLQGLVNRFRPNLVVSFSEPFSENSCSQIKIDNSMFKSDGRCTRCQMICIDQYTGEKTAEPLKTLSKESNGRICFGMYLSCVDHTEDQRINIGGQIIGYGA